MSLKRIQTSDQSLSLIQDNIDTALTPLQNSPLIGGVLLKNVSLVSGQVNPVPHNLGRVPTIFINSVPTENTTIWSPGADKTNLNLHCSTSCTVSVWVN